MNSRRHGRNNDEPDIPDQEDGMDLIVPTTRLESDHSDSDSDNEEIRRTEFLNRMVAFTGLRALDLPELLNDDENDPGADPMRGLLGIGRGDPRQPDSDTSALDVRAGQDIQGIPWSSLHFSRESYRETRILQYANYENVTQTSAYLRDSLAELHKEANEVKKGDKFYDFQHNSRAPKSTIVHFQLRNLVWAPSRNDVIMPYQFSLTHFSPRTQKVSPIMDLMNPPSTRGLRGNSAAESPFPPLMGRVQVSTLCVAEGLILVGGFHGELIIVKMGGGGMQEGETLGEVVFSGRLTQDDNPITNAVGVFQGKSSPQIFAANNDCVVRVMDLNSLSLVSEFTFSWPINHLSVSPNKKMMLVVGDDPEGFLIDSLSGQRIATLKGHQDFSFASAFHPNGRYFATGNQDATCRIWDVRHLKESLHLLKGNIGAIRSIRYSSDGRFMAMAEPADFIHIFDTTGDYNSCQEIDFFGEIAGFSFSPDTEALFVGIADRTYGSLMEFSRYHCHKHLDSFL